MWFSNIFRRRRSAPASAGEAAEGLTDIAFLRRLNRLALRTRRFLQGEAAGNRPSKQRLPTNDFRDHRLYLPGDDLRHVDWNASARAEHIFVKLGESPKEILVHLLVDNTASMIWGQPSKLWAARRLAATLGYLALNYGDRLAVAPLAGSDSYFGPARGKGRLPSLLRFLSALPAGPRADLAGVAQRYAARGPQGGLIILISDLLATPDLRAVLNLFPPPKWQLLVLHLLHRAELEPMFEGEIELQDIETGECANYDVDFKALERYRVFAAAWCEGRAQICREAGVAYARLFADWPIETAVMPFLQRRRVVQPA